MKNKILSTVVVLLLSTLAQARGLCLPSEHLTVCPGDTAVIAYNGSFFGRVVGVNPIEEWVSVQYENGVIDTTNLEYLSVGKGCIQGYCVGDRAVVSYNGSRGGVIVGVNPIKNWISVRYNNGTYDTSNIEYVSVESFCLKYPENHPVRKHSMQ